jgi:sugar lactone lactonase YvrE
MQSRDFTKLPMWGALSLSLVACVGPVGPVGPAGMNGADGTDGADGADGMDGRNGTDGTNGRNGTDGTNGRNGTDGTNGRNGTDAPVDNVILPGFFAPESIHTGSDGRIYVTSIATGAVATIAADGRAITTVIPAESVATAGGPQTIGKLGVYVDDARSDLWLCTLNTTTFASTLRRYDLATFAAEAEFPTVAGACNDIAMDSDGNVYITDSFTGIERLAAGGSALELWSANDLYSAGPGQFAIDGIVVDGTEIYVNNLTTGRLIQVGIQMDGTARAPVAIEGVTLTAPDGMRLRGPGRILVAESLANTLSEVTVDAVRHTGIRNVLNNRLDRPSAVAVSGEAAWVAEGQIGRVFGLDSTPLNVPFRVVRVPLF